MDTLLAGTLILPWRVHCAGMMSSATQPVEIIPGIVKAVPGCCENRSPSAWNYLSLSARNLVHLRPGTFFTFPPESRSPSPGIPHQRRRWRGITTLVLPLARWPLLRCPSLAGFQASPEGQTTAFGEILALGKRRWSASWHHGSWRGINCWTRPHRPPRPL